MKNVALLAYGETSPFALESLIKKFNVQWVVVPENDKIGNKKKLLPVEILAKKRNIKIVPTNDETKIYELLKKTPLDAVIISSYNKILSKKILKLSKFINIHHGDLPKYRGRANINWAIINNKKSIAICFHEAVFDLDSGNIYKKIIVPISIEDDVKTIYDKFNDLIKIHTHKIVEKVLAGFEGTKQKGKPTYCCTRLPEDGHIDWSKTSLEIYNLIRALTKPFPGAFTYLNGKKLFIWTSELPKNPKIFEGRIPGRIAFIHRGYGVEALTGDSSLIIKDISYGKNYANATSVINSVKTTLGINIAEMFEKLKK